MGTYLPAILTSNLAAVPKLGAVLNSRALTKVSYKILKRGVYASYTRRCSSVQFTWWVGPIYLMPSRCEWLWKHDKAINSLSSDALQRKCAKENCWPHPQGRRSALQNENDIIHISMVQTNTRPVKALDSMLKLDEVTNSSYLWVGLMNSSTITLLPERL